MYRWTDVTDWNAKIPVIAEQAGVCYAKARREKARRGYVSRQGRPRGPGTSRYDGVDWARIINEPGYLDVVSAQLGVSRQAIAGWGKEHGHLPQYLPRTFNQSRMAPVSYSTEDEAREAMALRNVILTETVLL